MGKPHSSIGSRVSYDPTLIFTLRGSTCPEGARARENLVVQALDTRFSRALRLPQNDGSSDFGTFSHRQSNSYTPSEKWLSRNLREDLRRSTWHKLSGTLWKS